MLGGYKKLLEIAGMSGKYRIFAPFKRKKGTIMETIIERTPGRITVSMSTRRWNRIQKLEQAYKLARIIKHSMEQAEKAPAMTVEQAIKHLEEL